MSDRLPSFTDEEIAELAGKIEARAKRGRIVHFTPLTARVVAHALRMSRPDRDRLVGYICPNKRCELRPCYSCIGKANEIINLLRDV